LYQGTTSVVPQTAPSFVSGHDFSRAANGAKFCIRARLQSCRKQRQALYQGTT
jgi:hypothetical protein